MKSKQQETLLTINNKLSVGEKLPIGESIVYLLRHGQIATPGILAGKTDVALSELGHSQLSQATETLNDISLCISSPLVRCYDWAKQYCHQQNLLLQVESKLQEMDFGDWDGKRYEKLWKKADSLTKYSTENSIGDFWQNPWQNQPPNGEPMEGFVKRVDEWRESFCAEIQLANTLVVTHGGVIKHILARVLNLPIPGTEHMSSIDVPYGCLIKISLYRDNTGKVWSKLVL